MSMPSTSRLPSPLTPTPMMTALETIHPASRTFTQVASSQIYGESPSSGAGQEGLDAIVDLTAAIPWLLEMPFIPLACNRRSTERVEMP